MTRFLQSLRRRTTSGLYIGPLDGLRFLAIVSVFLYHVASNVQNRSTAAEIASYESSILRDALLHMGIGVQLFFIISGMILSLPFASHFLQGRKAVSLKDYFLRRVTRLEPPYILTLLFFFAAKLLGARGDAGGMLPHLLSSLFYSHNWIHGGPSTINAVAWSLEIEIQFYILVPLLVRVFAIRSAMMRRMVLTAAVAALSVAATIAMKHDPWIKMTLAGHLQYFLTGFLLTDLFLAGRLEPESGPSWDLSAVFLTVISGIGLIAWDSSLAIAMFAPLALALITVAAFKGRVASRIFSSLTFTAIGGMCYSIYLVHNYALALAGQKVQPLLQGQPFEVRFAAGTLTAVIPVMVASIILYKAVEQPCMNPNWPRELWKFVTGARTTPASAAATVGETRA